MSESQFGSRTLLRILDKRDAEIKLLRELVEAGKEDRKTIDELVDENKRLLGLMRNLVNNAEGGDFGQIDILESDFIEIEKEVNDESE